MASESQVKQYLAYWFQLGKRVAVRNGQDFLLPETVIAGDRYSQAFEDCWAYLRSPESGDCYLEGTQETIAELLTPAWEVSPCARCAMPVPMKSLGVSNLDCPCFELDNWPDNETLRPRSPVDTQTLLMKIRDRLKQASLH